MEGGGRAGMFLRDSQGHRPLRDLPRDGAEPAEQTQGNPGFCALGLPPSGRGRIEGGRTGKGAGECGYQGEGRELETE